MLLEGSGEAIAAVSPASAFAFLADPRHAGEWFAGASFAVPPQGPPREGQSWSFARTPGTRRITPIRMAAYEPPRRFAWESQPSPLATGHRWELRCEQFIPAPDDNAQLDNAQLDDDASADTSPTPSRATQHTRLIMTISLRPGLVELASVAAGYVLVRRALREQAQRAVERAAAALEARESRISHSQHARDNSPGGKSHRNKNKRH